MEIKEGTSLACVGVHSVSDKKRSPKSLQDHQSHSMCLFIPEIAEGLFQIEPRWFWSNLDHSQESFSM